MLAVHKMRRLLGVSRKTFNEVAQEVETVYNELLEKEMECNDLRLEVLHQRSKVEDLKVLVPSEKLRPVVEKWDKYDKSLLKTAIQSDGSIRNMDEVEYERMKALVDKMKPVSGDDDAGPSGSGEIGDVVLGRPKVPVHVTASQVLVKKQCTLTFFKSPDGKKRLGFEFPKEQEGDGGFFSGCKRRK